LLPAAALDAPSLPQTSFVAAAVILAVTANGLVCFFVADKSRGTQARAHSIDPATCGNSFVIIPPCHADYEVMLMVLERRLAATTLGGWNWLQTVLLPAAVQFGFPLACTPVLDRIDLPQKHLENKHMCTRTRVLEHSRTVVGPLGPGSQRLDSKDTDTISGQAAPITTARRRRRTAARRTSCRSSPTRACVSTWPACASSLGSCLWKPSARLG
jgi:hypothetical protein